MDSRFVKTLGWFGNKKTQYLASSSSSVDRVWIHISLFLDGCGSGIQTDAPLSSRSQLVRHTHTHTYSDVQGALLSFGRK